MFKFYLHFCKKRRMLWNFINEDKTLFSRLDNKAFEAFNSGNVLRQFTCKRGPFIAHRRCHTPPRQLMSKEVKFLPNDVFVKMWATPYVNYLQDQKSYPGPWHERLKGRHKHQWNPNRNQEGPLSTRRILLLTNKRLWLYMMDIWQLENLRKGCRYKRCITTSSQ